MSNVRFTETVLRTKNKKGILTPDENGYYTLVIGGLNCYNSVGEYYTSSKEVTDLFQSSSHLMRRLSTGQLRGEQGHPKKVTGMAMNEWVNRIMTIDEACVCAHFSEIWLDMSYGKNNPEFNNPDLIAIMAKIKPAGPNASSLQASLENVKENVAFSIRAITENKMVNGRTEKALTQIITWDYVNEPGINIATKWNTPTLEDYTKEVIPSTLIVKIAQESLGGNLATESNRTIFNETVEKFSIAKEELINKNNRLQQW